MTDATLRMLLLGEDRGASKALNKVSDAADRTGNRTSAMSKLWETAGGMVKTGVTGLAVAGGALGALGLKTAASNEQASIAFTTMLGSAKRARSFLGELQTFAAKTPFEFPELQTAASSLISAGINAKKVIPIMTTLGDVTSGMGTGSEGVQRATIALQQMNAAGRITGEDLNQLRDAGIPVYDLLASATGKSKAEVVKLAQAGKLGKKELGEMMKALENGKGLERFSGLMDKQSASLAGMGATFKDTLGQGLAKALQPTIPLIKDGLVAATESLDEIIPAVVDGLGDLIQEGRDLAPVVKDVADKAHAAYEVFDSLPAPVKSVGIEMGIAALAIGKMKSMTSGLLPPFAATRTAMAEQVTMAGKTKAALGSLGGTARNVAGVAGMLALTEGAKQSNDAVSGLLKVAGGAATGFAIAGPIGAAGGAAASAAPLLWNLLDSVSGVKRGQQDAYPAAENYADSLDQVTGAATRNTRELIRNSLTQNGMLGLARRMDLTARDVIGATLGQAGATRRLNQATKAHIDQLDGHEQAKWNTWLRNNTDAYRDQRREVRRNYLDTASWKELLGKVPKKLITDIRALGASVSKKEITDLQRRYNLTPKQVKTILAAIGTEASIRKVKGVWTVLDATGKRKANLTTWETTLLAQLNQGLATTTRKVGGIDTLLSVGTSRARPNLAPFNAALGGAIDSGRSRAASGGSGIGSALGSGVYGGIGVWISDVVGRAASMVNQAIAAAHAAADAHSPSRKMIRLGGWLGRGLGIGMAREKTFIGKVGADIIDSVVDGIHKRRVRLSKVISEVGDYLKTQKSKLGDLIKARNEMAGQFTGMATSVFAGNSEGPTTVGTILAAQSHELAQARQVSKDMSTLKAKGMSSALIKQLAHSGAQGIDAMHALAGASASDIARLNSMDKSTRDNLTTAGMTAGNAYYGARIRNQQDRVDDTRHVLRELRHLVKDGMEGKVTIKLVGEDGRTIQTKLLKLKRHHGGKKLGLD